MKIFLLITFSLILNFNIFSQAVSIFSSSPSDGCSPLSVNFTDLSTGAISSWNWDFGNGNTSTLQNPSAVYTNPGTFTTSLTVSDGTTSNTSTETITVYANPVVSFTADNTIGCADLDVNFTNTSVTGTGIATVFWDFGDGNTSTATNPSHIFSEGTYNITAIITDNSGCTTQETETNFITAENSPTANFSATNTQSCSVPNTVNFTNTSINDLGASYSWDFGDGNSSTQENPTHTYTAFGNYDVSFVVSRNGCTDSIYLDNYVALATQTADFTSDFTSQCVGAPIQFSDLSALTANNYLWDFGDGNTSAAINPNHSYTTAGTYTVSLTTTLSGCNDSEVKTNYITIIESPNISFTVDQTDSCGAPFTVNYTSNTTSTINSYLWDFGDGNTSTATNPSHTYLTTGSYTTSLSATSANGCTATDIQIGLINISAPIADFEIDTVFGCAPKTVQITDLSSSPNGIETWLWDFGDGTTQNGPSNPSHTYIDTGVFNVSLTIIDSTGCTETLAPGVTVELGQSFNVDFSVMPNIVCKSDVVEFTNLTDTLGIGNLGWLWSFGDGGVLPTFDAEYQYADTGLFDVTLSTFHNGCVSSTTLEDTVQVYPPVAIFAIDVSCENYLEVSFIDQSIAPESWVWVINGDSSVSQNTTYTFPSAGNYPVSFYVENTSFGCIDSTSNNINIIEPIFDFSSSDSLGCAPFTTQFFDLSNLAVAWLWDFGDGSTSSFANPTHTYSQAGVYDITLVTENSYGCLDTLTYSQMITVLNSAPDFISLDSLGCSPHNVNFTDLSTSNGGPISNWNWDFGDGNSSTIQNPSHSYTNNGSYNVSLTTTDSAGCTNTNTKINYIIVNAPVAGFSYTNLACLTNDVAFTSNSFSPGGTITNWNWDFDDGNTSNLENPVHVFSTSGTYNVSLNIQDNNGCDTTISISSNITLDTIVANFGADTTIGNCSGFIVNFSDSSSINAIAWNWDFGNGTSSNLQNPSTIYSNIGDFDVTLIVENALGCLDTLLKPDFISVLGPTGTLTTSTDSGCVDLSVTFSITNTNSVQQTWDFGDGNVVVNNLLTMTHTYTDINTFFPLVVLRDASGCPSSNNFDTIYTGSLTAEMYIDTNYICTPNTVSFADSSDSSIPISSWNWDFGDGNSSNLQNPTHNYTQAGIFDISLTVSNGLCTETINELQYIVSDASTNALFTTSPPALLCPPSIFTFNENATADSTIANWNWNFGNGTNSNLQNPGAVVYNNSGNFTVTLDITTIKGCTDSYSETITINELPTLNFDLDSIALCINTDTILPSIQDDATISWTPSTNLSCNDCSTPTITAIASNTYFVTATNVFGCTVRDTLKVFVKNNPLITVSEDQKILIGETINLNAFSPETVTFEWTPTQNLSCDDCANTDFVALENTDLIVNITDFVGCKNTDTISVSVFDLCEKGYILFPNVFTPNGDSKNDVFKISRRNNLNAKINYFRIFDRWGKLLFESDDITQTWDGTFNGAILNNGVYVYVLDVICFDGTTQQYNGNVTLIR